MSARNPAAMAIAALLLSLVLMLTGCDRAATDSPPAAPAGPSSPAAAGTDAPPSPAPEPAASAVPADPPAALARPNILIIVADDLGYSDLGVYGGEDIATPNLDALAGEGVMFTGFYTAPTCSPTRAMLMSGTDNHIAGLGNMFEELAPNQQGRPGYEGYLNERVAWMAELLGDAGYHTFMTGKWHLGLSPETSPAARGFQRSFALLQGGAGHFDMQPIVGPGQAKYREDGEAITALPEDFYSTAFYTDRMIEYIDSQAGDDQPFLGYLAYSAPHWPLQAPAESIARYAGRYEGGYDALHAERLARMQALGLVGPDVQAAPRLAGEPAWDALSDADKALEAKKMAIYAAMVDDLDRYVGRLIAHLKAIGEYDNTFIFFMSDNGAEGHHLDRGWPALATWAQACCDNSYDNIGNADSYIWYGPNWGRAGTAPWRLFKGFTTEGGIRVPAFAHFPARFAGARRFSGFASAMDVLPTLLELAGVPGPGNRYRGRDIAAIEGRSMLAVLEGSATDVHPEGHWAGWELFGKRAIRDGDWKLVWTPAPYGPGAWELFNLATDPAEQQDLSGSHPEVLARLAGHWERYAADKHIIIPDRTSGY